jgi:hypothetical protein
MRMRWASDAARREQTENFDRIIFGNDKEKRQLE